jgi:hypothetical protein
MNRIPKHVLAIWVITIVAVMVGLTTLVEYAFTGRAFESVEAWIGSYIAAVSMYAHSMLRSGR